MGHGGVEAGKLGIWNLEFGILDPGTLESWNLRIEFFVEGFSGFSLSGFLQLLPPITKRCTNICDILHLFARIFGKYYTFMHEIV